MLHRALKGRRDSDDIQQVDRKHITDSKHQEHFNRDTNKGTCSLPSRVGIAVHPLRLKSAELTRAAVMVYPKW